MTEPVKKQHKPNHLANEKSPYLQQHAYNPVDWYPWGDEAFLRAEDEHKPVFLSIGYSTCHWCHVMAHESFENDDIAALLNKYFIAIKVDREERPDIDSVYMTACQQMTGQGGWPLTIIMMPDKRPFFAGTYLPATGRAGMTGFDDILKKIIRLWNDRKETLEDAAGQLTTVLEKIRAMPTSGTAGEFLLHDGYEELAASFDPVNGGFSGAPKFPTPATLMFLLRYWKRTDEIHARNMVEKTLDAMLCGGIHDHIGGGFHRYSTDARWRIPHFEKMLYDQALLLMAFTEAWQATKKPVYKKTAESIAAYVLRDLSAPEGAFFSAEDADSPGGEGAFYLWSMEELAAILGPDESQYAAPVFGVPGTVNVPDGDVSGKTILCRTNGCPGDPAAESRIDAIRNRLFEHRQARQRPARDEKILTDWNGLMVVALARSSRAFGNPEYCRAAGAAMRFILDRLRASDGGLLHRWSGGEAAIPAFADDYTFVITALIDLYATTFEPAWLKEALHFTRYLNDHFSDDEKGGFFTTSDRGDALIVRKKEIYDGAVPSCNSVMLRNLVMLGHLTGDPVYEEQASRLADSFAGLVRRSPSAYSAYLSGLDHLLGPATDVVIAGERRDPATADMIRVLDDLYLPSATTILSSSETVQDLKAIAPFVHTMIPQDDRVTAYVCSGRACSNPVFSAEALQEMIDKNRG